MREKIFLKNALLSWRLNCKFLSVNQLKKILVFEWLHNFMPIFIKHILTLKFLPFYYYRILDRFFRSLALGSFCQQSKFCIRHNIIRSLNDKFLSLNSCRIFVIFISRLVWRIFCYQSYVLLLNLLTVSHQSVWILLHDFKTYIKLSLEAIEILIAKIRSELSEVGGRYKSINLCSSQEKEFLSSKTLSFTVPHLCTS